jgi:hypothetical protein
MRQFIKEVLDLKTSIEWRFISTIRKTEPNKNSRIYNWSYLWKKMKDQSGSRCSSLKKNKQIGTLIKCINEKLPVAKKLAQRRPDLYMNAYCILCKEDTEEDQDHLAICKYYENIWKNIENTVINLA